MILYNLSIRSPTDEKDSSPTEKKEYTSSTYSNIKVRR